LAQACFRRRCRGLFIRVGGAAALTVAMPNVPSIAALPPEGSKEPISHHCPQDGKQLVPPPQQQQQQKLSAGQENQRDRLLQQMRKCVLVHHQLSCLLIEGAAQQAGICGDELNGVSLDIDPAANLSSASAGCKDFTAIDGSLQDRVDDIMGKIEGELEVVRNRAGGTVAQEATRDTSAPSTEQLEEEALEQQCLAAEQELEMERTEVVQLREELRTLQEASQKFQVSLTTACFDEVQRAEARVEALESVVSQLDAGPVDAAKVSAIVAHLDAAAAARAAAIASRQTSPSIGVSAICSAAGQRKVPSRGASVDTSAGLWQHQPTEPWGASQ